MRRTAIRSRVRSSNTSWLGWSACSRAAELYALDAPVLFAGDYNVVPTDADIYPTKSYKDNALVHPAPRALFARLLGQGWIDAIRKRHPDEPMLGRYSARIFLRMYQRRSASG